MISPSSSADRRARRSIRLLKQSFRELVSEKGFSSVTVQDITDRADVNRSTFYAHFTDKYALLDEIIRDKFQQHLENQLPQDAGWNKLHLGILIRTVLMYFEDVHGNCRNKETLNPMFEKVVQEELSEVLRRWLEKVRTEEWPVSIKTIALMTSWAIFGTAIAWSQRRDHASLEQMTAHILLVISDGVFQMTQQGIA
jgi:AcrR family transcriptional regulator